MSIRIGILGYGNLGRGVECAVKQNPDMELKAVFTRRDPETVKILTENAKVYRAEEAERLKDEIDVLILCGGSATDLPVQTPAFARWFNVVDSFDTHANIPQHFEAVDQAASERGHVGIISVGWDPGMFSLNRLYATAVLPEGSNYTFWGKGVSQGHSDAIRRIAGVKDARQYTIPVESALESVRNGENPELTTRQKHTRECFVVAEEGADLAAIEQEIKTMKNYFDEYDTTVHFISQEELDRDHNSVNLLGLQHRTALVHQSGYSIQAERKTAPHAVCKRLWKQMQLLCNRSDKQEPAIFLNKGLHCTGFCWIMIKQHLMQIGMQALCKAQTLSFPVQHACKCMLAQNAILLHILYIICHL